MLGALCSAPGSDAWGVRSVINDEMCAPLQVIHVVVFHTVGNILLEDIDGNEENAVICSHETSLRLSFGSPFVARVAPRTFILLRAPRISQSYKLGRCAIRVSDLYDALHSVCVTIGESHCILRKVVAT